MTTEIKAAIAGAIEALEKIILAYASINILEGINPSDSPAIVAAEKSLAALRRIEFVEVNAHEYGLYDKVWEDAHKLYRKANSGVRGQSITPVNFLEFWMMVAFINHLTTTGHAIVKMGDV
jgi:hypothetical protein